MRLAPTITITKCQGQSLEMCGLHLDRDYFANTQLYVADNLCRKYVDGENKNIVYPHVLRLRSYYSGVPTDVMQLHYYIILILNKILIFI